jgi:hypothetical protein
MRESIKLPAAVAPGLILLTIIWVAWGQFPAIFDSSPNDKQQPERMSIGPILFVVVLGSIIWMVYGISEHGKIKLLAQLTRRLYCPPLSSEPADNTSQQPPEQNIQLEENLRIIRELKREMQGATSAAS